MDNVALAYGFLAFQIGALCLYFAIKLTIRNEKRSNPEKAHEFSHRLYIALYGAAIFFLIVGIFEMYNELIK